MHCKPWNLLQHHRHAQGPGPVTRRSRHDRGLHGEAVETKLVGRRAGVTALFAGSEPPPTIQKPASSPVVGLRCPLEPHHTTPSVLSKECGRGPFLPRLRLNATQAGRSKPSRQPCRAVCRMPLVGRRCRLLYPATLTGEAEEGGRRLALQQSHGYSNPWPKENRTLGTSGGDVSSIIPSYRVTWLGSRGLDL